MQVYFVRHGKAEPLQAGIDDRERPLSPEGVRQVKRLAIVWAWMQLEVHRILSSPYLRARQTAEIIAEVLQVPVDIVPSLSPHCSLADVAELTYAYRGEPSLMVVGHQPALGQIVQALTGGLVEVKPGTMVGVESGSFRPGRGLLIGLYDPELMENLAEH